MKEEKVNAYCDCRPPFEVVCRDLIGNWESDPCYDLWEVAGYEDWADDLRAYQKMKEKEWHEANRKVLAEINRLGCSLTMYDYLKSLELRIQRLEEHIEEVS